MSLQLTCKNKKCGHFGNLVDAVIRPNGPHQEAFCSICGGYIKFVSGKELKLAGISKSATSVPSAVSQEPSTAHIPVKTTPAPKMVITAHDFCSIIADIKQTSFTKIEFVSSQNCVNVYKDETLVYSKTL